MGMVIPEKALTVGKTWNEVRHWLYKRKVETFLSPRRNNRNKWMIMRRRMIMITNQRSLNLRYLLWTFITGWRSRSILFVEGVACPGSISLWKVWLVYDPLSCCVGDNNNKLHGLWNPEVQCRIHKGSSIIPILNRINSITRIDTFLFKVHSNTCVPSTPRPP